MKTFHLIFLLFIIPTNIIAQKEAAVWSVGSGRQFNFESGNIEISTFTGNNKANSTICDKDGNLILYTDGRTVWNANNEVLINGAQLINEDAYISNAPIFIPYPKKEGWYILFYEEEYNTINAGSYQNSIYFAEINTNAYNGKGEVVKQKVKIHNNYHSDLTIAGFCNNSYFWLIVDRNDNLFEAERDRIFFYKIDENGVNLTPKINDLFDIGSSSGYRFSPNGDKLYFSYSENHGSGFWNVIADFNFLTGELYNYRTLRPKVNLRKEFSPNSQLIYFFSGPYLLQLDARYSDKNLLKQSIDTIFALQHPGYDLQLAPDGKVYFYYSDINDNLNKIGRINKPNKKGDACDVELEIAIMNLNYPFFPKFVTSFFRDKTPENMDEVFPEAGPELELCSGSSSTLGIAESSNAFYHWYPDADLSEPFSAQTIFSPPVFYGSPKTITFTLVATDGNCWVNFDSTSVTVKPIPEELPIDGSWSVCPFVEEVDYWTVDDGNNLHWLVDGGEIATNPASDSVKINWWGTNANASTSVFSTNSYECSSDTSVFQVRINVELITETPNGPNKICIAERKNIEYKIRNTNGSEYYWNPEGGKVISGQGTNHVVVNWFAAGLFQISVEETSRTIDTICFGESVPLQVEIINDSLEISLTQVTYNNENNVEIKYNSEKLESPNHQLWQIVENEQGDILNETNLYFIYSVYPEILTYYNSPNQFIPRTFRLKVVNSCNEIFYSNSLQTVVLEGREISYQNSIRLNWNLNRFWENDRLTHEIWHSVNRKDGWEKVARVEAVTEYNFLVSDISPNHYFRVREYNEDKEIESWSNTIEIEIDEKIVIPDVFTPNGDGYNDTWEIEKINFHPFGSVVVFNKYGHKVYECKNEYIPWDGKINGEIFQGTYFYQITFDAENIKYGQITILQ